MNATASMFMVCAALLLAACSVPGAHHDPGAAPASAANGLSDSRMKRSDVHLTLIRDMIAKGQYYAALAHIQAQQKTVGKDDPQLRLLEANTRRDLGEYAKAGALYKTLQGGPLNGQAMHGLGLLHAHEGDLKTAIAELRKAAQQLPTSVDIRNDLGYALMQAGDYNAALPQLSTAAELAPHELRSRRNLIILMYLMGRPRDAAHMASRSGLDRAQLLKLERQARTMQDQGQPLGNNPGPQAVG